MNRLELIQDVFKTFTTFFLLQNWFPLISDLSALREFKVNGNKIIQKYI